MKTIESAIKTININEIKHTFDVRSKLDQDRVLTFADLYENNINLPPIILTKDLLLVDGRHRIEALKLLGRNEASYQTMLSDDMTEIITESFRCNIGGALPPTVEDIKHTLGLLINQGVSQRKILDSFPLDQRIIHKYLKIVKEDRTKKRMVHILDGIVQGKTIHEMALQYDVPITNIREAIRRRKEKKTNSQYVQMKKFIEVRSIALTRSYNKNLITAINNFSEGEFNREDINNLIEKIKATLSQTRGAGENAIQRLENLLSNPLSPISAPEED